MPLPEWLARLNRSGINRVTRPVAERLPGFAVVIHTGVRTGRRYRTPVNMFRSGDGYVIALTYGRERDWVKNVLAAGGCEVETRGSSLALTEPRIVRDERQSRAPLAIRPILKALGVKEFLELRRSQPSRSSG
jgi:deazaflavin-dependent oxidoreductase (nitroreductase family)